jgi:hypothetical protein
MIRRILKTAAAATCGLAVAVTGLAITQAATSTAALAVQNDQAERITLNNGTVYEGEVIREGDSFLFIRAKVGGVLKNQMVRKADIASRELVGQDAPEAEDTHDARSNVAVNDPFTPEAKVIPEGATRIAFLTLHKGVGEYFNKVSLKRAVEMLDDLPERERPDIVVLHINSPGGISLEREAMSEYIHHELKSKYRTVAWVEWAISAGAMTAWTCNEILVTEDASIGGCTTWFGGGTAVEGMDLERVLYNMEIVSKWGKKEPLVMRAMQIQMGLSADIDEDGNVTWYADETSGEFLVNPSDEVLTMTAPNAVKFSVAEAVANNKDEVARALGCTEWVEVGQEANEYLFKFRENVERARIKLGQLYQYLQQDIAAAQAIANQNEREKQVGKAMQRVRQMRAWLDRVPSLAQWTQFTYELIDQLEREVERIARNI